MLKQSRAEPLVQFEVGFGQLFFSIPEVRGFRAKAAGRPAPLSSATACKAGNASWSDGNLPLTFSKALATLLQLVALRSSQGGLGKL